MESTNNQCPYCHRWITSARGGFKHHVRTCRPDDNTSKNKRSTNKRPSTNPLLSRHIVGQTENIEYDCDYVGDDEYNEGINNEITEFRTNDGHKFDNSTMYNKSPKSLSLVTKFQVGLSDIVNKHKASLQMYDEVCILVNEYTSSPYFDRDAKLQSRKSFLKRIEESHGMNSMRPMDCNVTLHDDTVVTVPVFDTKAMIISLLTDSSIMTTANFAEGYDVLSGDVDMNNPCNHKYGEVHTGDAWMPAMERYCNDATNNGKIMPVGLIVFGDKSHTDLHGILSLTPIIFTLTLFNRSARNNTNVWRPMGYIPNLSAGKGTANTSLTRDKIQDEHTCLSCIFQSLRKITQEGGFRLVVLGENVHVKVWIHYFIGDTEGHNKWLGQYPGNKEGVQRPYRDCKCTYSSLNVTNPSCQYITLKDIDVAKKRKREDIDGGASYFKSISRYDITNAFTEKHMPLSDHVHGPFKMMPPELLHTSGSGLIMYMFESLRMQIGGGKDRDFLDKQHVLISNILKRQSERDIPRGSMRNGIIDGTKCQSSERKGNLFRFMCIAHTTIGRNVLQNSLNLSDVNWKKFILFLKMYMAMEEWFHDCNDKEEVKKSRGEISKVLTMLQRFFPRGNNTNGYNIPKLHGMAKMQNYILLFGSGMNFYGGPGEAAHKTFVKSAGQKTQRRVSEFASQTAKQYYNMMLTSYAVSTSVQESSKLQQFAGYKDKPSKSKVAKDEEDVVDISLSGKYEFAVTLDIIRMMEEEGSLDVTWTFDNEKKYDNSQFKLKNELVKVIHRRLTKLMLLDEKPPSLMVKKVTGYTKAVITSSCNERSIFYAHPCFQGEEWYDWAMIHFEETNDLGESIETYYPSLLHGFIIIDGEREAVVQCSLKPLDWDDVERNFIQSIQLGTDFDVSYVSVPVNSIVLPLCVFPDNGDDRDKYFVVLPKRNWSRVFGNVIRTSNMLN